MRDIHFTMAGSHATDHRPHAQSWVVSALYGVLLLCGCQNEAAADALSFAQNVAYLVGDLQSHQLIQELVTRLEAERRPDPITRAHSIERQYSRTTQSITAFIPSLDNVLAKANQYGAPPALFLRALLHRAILFADKIAIGPNVIVNSSVFVNDVLFGSTDTINTFYLNYLYPIVWLKPDGPEPDRQNVIASMYRSVNERNGYISERLMQTHMEMLDEYFQSVSTGDRCIDVELDGVLASKVDTSLDVRDP